MLSLIPKLQSQMLPAPAQPGQISPQEMLLAQMSDVITPQPVGLWPPAPGWWLLALLVCISVAVCIFLLWRRRRENRYKKLALAELDIIRRNFVERGNNDLAQAVNAVLKKAALSAYPHSRNQLAALYGRQWLEFLDRALKKTAPQSPDKSWIDKMYQPFAGGESIDRETLQQYARHWVKHHARLTPLQVQQLLSEQAETRLPTLAEANYV